MDSQAGLNVPQDALCKRAARSDLQSYSSAARLVTHFLRYASTLSLLIILNDKDRRDASTQESVLPALSHKVALSPTALAPHVCGCEGCCSSFSI